MIQLAPLPVGVRRAFQSLACLLAVCLPALAQFQAAELIPSVNVASYGFGASLAIDGDTAVIGAPQFANSGSGYPGAVFVFRRVSGAWTQEAMITAGPENGVNFGRAVAIAGNRIFASSTYSGFNLPHAGEVSVYRRTGAFPFATWDLTATIESSDPAILQIFGTSLAVSGSTLLVGADGPGALGWAVYFFALTNGTWQLQQRVPVDLGYGKKVCMDGDRAAVGRVYNPASYVETARVYGRVSGAWQQQFAFEGPQFQGASTETFAMDLRGDLLICGQPAQGRVIVARATGAIWSPPIALDWSANFPNAFKLGSSVGTDGTRFVATVPERVIGNYLDPLIAVGEWPQGSSGPSWRGYFRPDDDLTYLRGVAMSGDLVICRDENDENVKVLTLVPPAPVTYCTGKLNSAGCVGTVSSVGSASATSSAPFGINATSIVSGKYGLLFFGINGRTSFPFQGGYLCALPPTRRTPAQSSGGNAGANDCSGSYSFDFNALIRSGAHPDLEPGVLVNAQYWYRDPASQSTTGLTNAIEFGVGF